MRKDQFLPENLIFNNFEEIDGRWQSLSLAEKENVLNRLDLYLMMKKASYAAEKAAQKKALKNK